ncbi:MAG: hypothetical protein A2Y40_05830 [Candidatus Margulisbacteria bacterium GWF2_35_9]|nr:MAG: hypothetical protein A2Y40_05830 [Candidatus Margulisbacteria bacterium GWF2_35_9]
MIKSANSRKSGVVLLETLLALILMSIIIIPWINFLKARSMSDTQQKLNLFFETKQVLLDTVNKKTDISRIEKPNANFIITKTKIDNTLYQIEVSCVQDGKVKVSLVGVSRD